MKPFATVIILTPALINSYILIYATIQRLKKDSTQDHILGTAFNNLFTMGTFLWNGGIV